MKESIVIIDACMMLCLSSPSGVMWALTVLAESFKNERKGLSCVPDSDKSLARALVIPIRRILSSCITNCAFSSMSSMPERARLTHITAEVRSGQVNLFGECHRET
ncbi:hypothetical protein C8F01DRAFT_747106 [Mycena amicta]|nr:hypothetical protein C8F01DRAFT_747106 [Mycena amicta]